jgi:hypothetical protein
LVSLRTSCAAKVRVPATVVTRFYPRAVAMGNPDLIENALMAASQGEEFWLEKLPGQVFTTQIPQE